MLGFNPPDTSAPFFPACCPGDRRHAAAGGCRGGCRCHPASRSEDHMPASNKGFVRRLTKKKEPYRTAGITIAPLSVVVPSRPVFFFLQYVILSLRLPVSIPSLPRSPVFLPVFGVIMLLSRSLLSECSLAELIFGWCYITAPPSHLGADLLRSQDKQAVKWKPEKTL